MDHKFISIEQIVASRALSQVYLAKRKEDKEAFEKSLVLGYDDGVTCHHFDNGYTAYFAGVNDSIMLIKPDGILEQRFASLEQFSAYYLAKFW